MPSPVMPTTFEMAPILPNDESYALPAEAAEELDIETPVKRLEGREVLDPILNYGDHQSPSAHEFRRAQNPP